MTEERFAEFERAVKEHDSNLTKKLNVANELLNRTEEFLSNLPHIKIFCDKVGSYPQIALGYTRSITYRHGNRWELVVRVNNLNNNDIMPVRSCSRYFRLLAATQIHELLDKMQAEFRKQDLETDFNKGEENVN